VNAFNDCHSSAVLLSSGYFSAAYYTAKPRRTLLGKLS
jgi:hypothetical protein